MQSVQARRSLLTAVTRSARFEKPSHLRRVLNVPGEAGVRVEGWPSRFVLSRSHAGEAGSVATFYAGSSDVDGVGSRSSARSTNWRSLVGSTDYEEVSSLQESRNVDLITELQRAPTRLEVPGHLSDGSPFLTEFQMASDEANGT
jgi:hypothetical protein